MRYSSVAGFLVLFGVELALAQTTVPIYGQCGGQGYTGSTICAAGSVCVYQNDFYSQCVAGSGPTTTASSSSAASSTKTSSTTTKATSSSTTSKATTSATSSSTTSTKASSTTVSTSPSCTVASAAAAASVSSCATVVINSFTVASGTTVDFKFATGASVIMNGDITFDKTTSSGPLITFEGTSVTFNGNGHTINGNGQLYWDGEGTNGGVTKPHPFAKIKISGTFEKTTILNTPAQAISLGNSAALLIDSVTVDNSAGDAGALGHNTDGFDCSESDVTIQNSVVKNQDDCIAMNNGSNITFKNNQCSGGHGISIGSIASAHSVSGVTISGNTVTNSMYGLRIKIDSDATSGGVSDVTYSGNTVSGISKYGILITQSYSDDFGTPGTDTTVTGINFTGATTTVSVNSSATRVGVDCGNCSGTWDWSSLVATGGKGDDLVLDDAKISGGSY